MSETPPSGPIAEAPTLATAARWVVIVVGAFFLLRELGPILKPLFLAVLLGYVILPVHLRVKKWVPGRLSLMASQVSDAFGTKTRVNPDAVWNGSFLPTRAELNILPLRK